MMSIMKKKIFIPIAVALTAVACTTPDYDVKDGTLSFDSFSVSLDDSYTTKAVSDAPGTYSIIITDSEGGEKLNTTLASCAGGVTLPAGQYSITASSSAALPPAAVFDAPVYSAASAFTILPGKTTNAGDLVCTLTQCAVTVGYTDEFLEMVTGNGSTTVTVTSGSPLVYNLNHSTSGCSYEQRAGYFTVNNGANTTMEVVFKGNIDGKEQKMTKVFTGIAARQWRSITFTKKVSIEGNATFDIIINDYVEDEDLDHLIAAQETVIGVDPSGPVDDGGITLVSTCSYDIDSPITVPAASQPFTLTMKAGIPNGVRKFTVEIQSTSENFVNSVAAINEGATVLDLVNPSSGAEQVFTSILPFPYGADVYGQTEIDFDLSDAQVPILAFPGTHTFVMKVTDQKGCRKDISIVLTVN